MKIPQAKKSKKIQQTLLSIFESIEEEYGNELALDFMADFLPHECDLRIYHEDDIDPDDVEGLMRDGMKMGIKFLELIELGKRPQIYRVTVPWEQTDVFFVGTAQEIVKRLIRNSAANYG